MLYLKNDVHFLKLLQKPYFSISDNTFDPCLATGFFYHTHDKNSTIVNFIFTLGAIMMLQSKLLQYLKMQKVGYLVSFKKDTILPRLGCMGSDEDI